MTDLRILLLGTTGQDYMADDLLYGFRTLFGKNAVDSPRKDMLYADFEGFIHPRPEYAMNAKYFYDDPVDRNVEADAKDFDLVINLSCRRNPNEADICVDGEDDRDIATPACHLLFKRELAQDIAQRDPSILPITFGLPDHLAPPWSLAGLFDRKPVEVHSSFTVMHGPNRGRLSAEWPVRKYHTREKYLVELNKSKYVLSPMGAGWDCQRHYEILGRAVPIIEVRPDAPTHFINMWRDGENCLTFDGNADIIKEKIAEVDSHQWDRMIRTGYDELIEQYTASAVAKDLLKRAGVDY